MDFNKKVYFLITGASRGIGKRMAIECCKKFQPGSVAVLVARSAEGLEATKSEILSVSTGVDVKTYSLDLGTTDAKAFEDTLTDSLTGRKADDFDLAFVIHNAGTVGDVSRKAKEFKDIPNWVDYYKVNVFSVISLNCAFMQSFAGQKKLVVNVTSKCGIEPFSSMAEYCSGKAAREMYFRVLAVEEKDTQVLNYAPGPVETDMTVYVQKDSCDETVSSMFKQMRQTQTILTTEQTTLKFLTILEKNAFKSGDHVDYYD